MLTKTKNIRKKSKKKKKKKKIKKSPGVWPRGSHNQNLKEIRALGSEIIATQTNGRHTMDDRRRTNFDFMSSADIVKQS